MKTLLVVLGGGLQQTTTGEWQTCDFKHGDTFGASGDRLRVAAGALLYAKAKQNTSVRILASGGKGQYHDRNNAPAIARVLRQELIAHGVVRQHIDLDLASNNTYEQLLLIQKLCLHKHIEQTILISNAWHLPRIRAFLTHIPQLKLLTQLTKLRLTAAEDVMLRHDAKRWKDAIKKFYMSAALKKRMRAERQGIRALRAGRYKF